MDYIFLYIEIPLNLISMTKNLTLFVFLAIIACKKPDTYSITITAQTGGSVSTSGGTYEEGEVLLITATPAADYQFVRWSDGSTANPYVLNVHQNTTLEAQFEKITYTLSVTIEGEGEVEQRRVDSGKSTDYEVGSRVELQANAAAHWRFSHWSGVVSSTQNPIEVTMDRSIALTAVFVKSKYALSVDIVGKGTVRETLISTAEKTAYEGGSRVELTAHPDEHWAFAGWSGAVSSTDNPIDIEMTGAHTVTVTFVRHQYALDVGIIGQGTVNQAVVSASRSIDYQAETEVQLVAQPANGSIFYAWSGDITATDDRVNVVMDKSKQVTATFEVQATTLLDNNNIFIGVGKWRIRRPRTFFRNTNDCVPEEVIFTAEGTFSLRTATSSVTGNYRVDGASKVTLWQNHNVFATLDDLVLSKSFIVFNYQTHAGCKQRIEGDKDTTYVEPESAFKVTASQTAFQFGYAATTGQVLFNTSNITVRSEAKWIHLALSNQRLDFSTTENTSTSNKEAVINVYYGTITDTPAVVISIKQSDKPVTSKITLASNGVTVECPNAPIGHKEVVKGKEYEVVDLAMLKAKIVNKEAVDCVCTSQITSMDGLFKDNSTFNQDISSWDTSQVTTFEKMFQNAISFNGKLNHWNTAKVTNMAMLFKGASLFNQPIDSWNTSQVTTMEGMFLAARTFNQPLAEWDVRKVQNFDQMFYKAASFNRPLNTWKTDKAIAMSYMFSEAHAFNQSLNQWNTSKVLRMDYMFLKATSFNGDITTWNVSQVTTLQGMFEEAGLFNQNIQNWSVSKVSNMAQMFYNAFSFNQNLMGWCVAKVTTAPHNFTHENSIFQEAQHPIWGACPTGD